jgi:hypothetical protein
MWFVLLPASAWLGFGCDGGGRGAVGGWVAVLALAARRTRRR